jgi:hypothetical protein
MPTKAFTAKKQILSALRAPCSRLTVDDEELILEATLTGHLIDLLQWRMADSREVGAAVKERLLKFGFKDAEMDKLMTGKDLPTTELVAIIIKALEKALLAAIGRFK